MRCHVLCLTLLASCGGTDEPPLTNDTTLQCPTPAGLPFRLATHGFVHAENATLAKTDPRFKDEASDTVGNPGGASASIYLADGAAPAAGAIAYRGVKARTKEDQGLFNFPLPGEHVSLWTYDGSAWQDLGGADTDADGVYELPDTGLVAANDQPVFSLLEADGSCAAHHDFLLAPGAKVVITDIDGTLTFDDNELRMQVSDGTYVPKMMGAANLMTQAWANKGYPVIYLTARPHLFRTDTQAWLEQLGFPPGPVITSNGTTGDAGAYKTIWLQRMLATFGWKAVAVYGNADTDITAYNNAGIAKALTFIVGPLAGNSGTVAIANNDFTAHIASFVMAQPNDN
jgi:hypothetical protein